MTKISTNLSSFSARKIDQSFNTNEAVGFEKPSGKRYPFGDWDWEIVSFGEFSAVANQNGNSMENEQVSLTGMWI